MLYKNGFSKDEIINIGRFLDGIFAMSKPSVLNYNQFIKEVEKELDVSYITDMEQMGIEQGLERGRKLGRQEGHKDGERTLLRHQLKLKFKNVLLKLFISLQRT